MKILTLTGAGLLLAAGTALSAPGQDEYRTDINPALRYFQAIIMNADLSKDDNDFLFANKTDWRGQKLPERFGSIVSQYNNSFKMMNAAAHATVPCDFGVDLSPGPETLLPHLARLKRLALLARYRAMWELQSNDQTAAREDLLAGYVLGRNSGRDGVLISVLVQFACEDIVYNTIAENFGKLKPETLKELMDGFDAAPARMTVAASMGIEKSGFAEWYGKKIRQWQQENPGGTTVVMHKIRGLFEGISAGDNGQTDTNLWPQIVAGSGGTSDGVLKLLQESESLYSRVTVVLSLPHEQYEPQMKAFAAEVHDSPNPFIKLLFPSLEKCRLKEFRIQVRQAMIRAAAEYKLNGEAGFKSVQDPFGNGPFVFERFGFHGVDRGFKLTSAFAGRGYPEACIFVEREGAPFNLQGEKIGESLEAAAAK